MEDSFHNQQLSKRLVSEKIYFSATPLIESLLAMEGVQGWDYYDDLAELRQPIPRFEEALRSEGFVKNKTESWVHPEHGEFVDVEPEQICRELSISVEEKDPFEFWIVDGEVDGLASKLKEKGEKVCEVAGIAIWARTAFGQSIAMDRVIQTIALEVYS